MQQVRKKMENHVSINITLVRSLLDNMYYTIPWGWCAYVRPPPSPSEPPRKEMYCNVNA